tara:strand:- start:505 stop:666 length:162 start_codon:yes stop_codon:yes gene_type:complete
MKKYQFTRVETIRSIQIIQAESQEQAEEQLETEGYDESCDDVISSDTEIEEIK